MKPSPQFVVYLVGITVFGIFYNQVKIALDNGGMLLISAIAYAVVLRLLGYLLVRMLKRKKACSETINKSSN